MFIKQDIFKFIRGYIDISVTINFNDVYMKTGK